MASAWNLWVCLECIGVVSGIVRRYINILIIIITFSTPLVLALFWQQHPFFFVYFLCFFVL